MARVQTNTTIQQSQKSVTAAPSGVQARPAAVAPSGAGKLLASLASLSPKINQLAEEAKAQYQEKETNRALDTIAGMTHEEARQAVQSGQLRETESPWFQAAFEKQFGLAQAGQKRRDIITAYNNDFDKQNGDIEEFLAGYARQDVEEYGSNPLVMAGLREGMKGVFEKVRDTQAQYKDDYRMGERNVQFGSIVQQVTSSAIENGEDPTGAITSAMSQHEAALGMTPEQMDEQRLAAANNLALQGDVEGTQALLSVNYKGRGSLLSRTDTADKAARIVADAKTARGKALRTANTDVIVGLDSRASEGTLTGSDMETLRNLTSSGAISTATYEGTLKKNAAAIKASAFRAEKTNLKSEAVSRASDLVTSGHAASVQDQDVTLSDGSEMTIRGADLRQEVVNEQIEAMNAKGVPITQQVQQYASWGVAEKVPEWADTMNNGVASLTNALATNDEKGDLKVPDTALAGYAQWKAMAGAPNVRNRHVSSGDAAAIYRDAEILEKFGVMDGQEALMFSAKIDRKAAGAGISSSIDRNAFQSAIRKATSTGFFGGSTFNDGMASAVIEKQARILMAGGVDMDRAVKAATDSFRESYTDINGVWVNTRDRAIPQGFEGIAEAALESYQKAHPDEDDDLTLWPDPEQDYWIVADSFGIPAPGAKRIHITDLQRNPNVYGMDDANKELDERETWLAPEGDLTTPVGSGPNSPKYFKR